MSESERQATDLTYECELDAPPEKVWRALSVPELRARWLPDLAAAEPIASTPGEEARYRLRDDAPPFLESEVTFRVLPNGAGGARLRIVHRLTDPRLARPARAANDNRRVLMRAA